MSARHDKLRDDEKESFFSQGQPTPLQREEHVDPIRCVLLAVLCFIAGMLVMRFFWTGMTSP